MKKIFLTLSLALLTLGASAQDQGDMAVGVNFSYGTEIKNPAIGAKFQYYILDKLRAEASADYWFKKHDITYYDINVNAHYLFDLSYATKLYPLAGVGYLGYSSSVLSNSGKFAVNLGAGIQHNLSEKIGIGAEVKYQIVEHTNQLVISIGAIYNL